MKILLLIAEHGYSFVNQATALAKGLSLLGISNQTLKITDGSLDVAKINDFTPDSIISIGDWHDFELLVNQPQKLGYKVVPWIVADGEGKTFVPHYNQLSCILATSSHTRDLLVEAGITPQIIHVLPEAVDNDYWQPVDEEEIEKFLKLISIQDDSLALPLHFDLVKARKEEIPILFTTGGYATGKGVQEAMVALSKITPVVPWIYVIKTWPGTKSFQYSLQEMELAQRLGIGERIRYIVGEFSSDFIRNLMCACDIYVSPSRHEGFGLPLIEAQLCGKPVISINATATAETVVHNTTGFLASRDTTTTEIRADVNELATYLQQLLGDAVLRQAMGKRARQHAEANYSPSVIAQKLTQIINTLVAP